jgi:beta-N-acetylhexosaminidase
MSDDLSMEALDGPIGTRAKAALFAGCDVVLHCNGRLDEMKDVAGQTRELEGQAAERAAAALACLKSVAPFDFAAAQSRLDAMIGAVA